MWGAFFTWGIPMFVIGIMAGYAFAPRKGGKSRGTK